jgi:ariadne-1
MTLPCPSCAEEVRPERLRGILSPATLHKYTTLVDMELQNKRVRDDPNLTWCPSPDCSTIVSRPKEGDERRVACQTCCNEFCFECRGPAHSRTCDEAKRRQGKRDEVAFLKWAKTATKPCPDCKTLIERNKQDGSQDCNHMTCSKCKTEFCWLCGRKASPGRRWWCESIGCVLTLPL